VRTDTAPLVNKTVSSTTTRRRIGITRREAISPDLLCALNRGEIESATLAEWLAVDMAVLVGVVWRQLGLSKHNGPDTSLLRSLGVTRRLQYIAQSIELALPASRQKRAATIRAIATHRSDVVRQWAAYLVGIRARLDLCERLEQIRPFAADQNMSVRECAWMALRPHVTTELSRALIALEPWALDVDPNVRRFAIEITRPRGVWCTHIPELKSAPQTAAALLEIVRADPSNYVQRSAGNWLNDAGKSCPGWVKDLCFRWLQESDTLATRRIVRRSMRNI